MYKGKPWSTEEENKIVELFKNGKQYQEISEIVGRSLGGIISRFKKIAINMKKEGKIPEEIKTSTGINLELETFSDEPKKVEKMGTLEKEVIKNLVSENINPDEISKRVGRPQRQVEQYIERKSIQDSIDCLRLVMSDILMELKNINETLKKD